MKTEVACRRNLIPVLPRTLKLDMFADLRL